MHGRFRPTTAVREALSTMVKVQANSSAGKAARQPRFSVMKTAATAAHIIRLARWLGWRRLPAARPGMP